MIIIMITNGEKVRIRFQFLFNAKIATIFWVLIWGVIKKKDKNNRI
jgi:hypothetical protein